MKKVIVALLLAVTATAPAYAWGDREQGILSGIAGVLLWQRLNQPQVIQQVPVPVPAPAPVIIHPNQPSVYNGIDLRSYYNCLVTVYDPLTNTYRNQVMTCVR